MFSVGVAKSLGRDAKAKPNTGASGAKHRSSSNVAPPLNSSNATAALLVLIPSTIKGYLRREPQVFYFITL